MDSTIRTVSLTILSHQYKGITIKAHVQVPINEEVLDSVLKQHVSQATIEITRIYSERLVDGITVSAQVQVPFNEEIIKEVLNEHIGQHRRIMPVLLCTGSGLPGRG